MNKPIKTNSQILSDYKSQADNTGESELSIYLSEMLGETISGDNDAMSSITPAITKIHRLEQEMSYVASAASGIGAINERVKNSSDAMRDMLMVVYALSVKVERLQNAVDVLTKKLDAEDVTNLDANYNDSVKGDLI